MNLGGMPAIPTSGAVNGVGRTACVISMAADRIWTALAVPVLLPDLKICDLSDIC